MAAKLAKELSAAMGRDQGAQPPRWSASSILQSLLSLFPGVVLDTDDIEFVLDDNEPGYMEKGSRLFLNKYTGDQVTKLVMATPELRHKLEALGFQDLVVTIDATDSFVHHVYMYDRGPHTIMSPACNIWPRALRDDEQERRRLDMGAHECLLMELSIRLRDCISGFRACRARYADSNTKGFLQSFGSLPRLNLLDVEWLLLQNPTRCHAFSGQMLPGQRYPGLHVGREIALMIVQLSEQDHRDGIVNCPLYFHNAVFYAHGGCVFVNPEYEGVFRTLCTDLIPWLVDPKYGLAVVSRAIFQGRLIHKPTGRSVKWIAQEQIFPLSQRVKSLLNSREYRSIANRFVTEGVFEMDWDGSPPSSEEEWAETIAIGDLPLFFKTATEWRALKSARMGPERVTNDTAEAVI